MRAGVERARSEKRFAEMFADGPVLSEQAGGLSEGKPSMLQRLLGGGNKRLAALLLAGVAALAAQAPAEAEAQQHRQRGQVAASNVAQVTYGHIMEVTTVQVPGQGSGIGAVTGGLAGGIAGSYIGGDRRSKALAAIGAALVGGLAGNALESAARGGTAMQYLIRQQNGQMVAVTLEDMGLRRGDGVAMIWQNRNQIRSLMPAEVPDMAPVHAGGMAGGMGQVRQFDRPLRPLNRMVPAREVPPPNREVTAGNPGSGNFSVERFGPEVMTAGMGLCREGRVQIYRGGARTQIQDILLCRQQGGNTPYAAYEIENGMHSRHGHGAHFAAAAPRPR